MRTLDDGGESVGQQMGHHARVRSDGFILFAAIAAVLLLLAIVLATWYLINIPDRPLDPGITATLQQRHDAVRPQDNLFFALLAFDSTNAEDINQQGQAIYAAYLARRATIPSQASPSTMPYRSCARHLSETGPAYVEAGETGRLR